MKIFNRNNNIKIGELGEKIAEQYLKKNGYKILDKNFTNSFGKKLGEIDIIAKSKNVLVFIEVKTRSSLIAIPEENITFSKLKKLTKIINIYISTKKLWDSSYRLDAISITINKNSKKYSLKHLKNIYL